MRQVLGEEATPLTRLVELPGRGVTRMWECAGPPGAETLMRIHGVACTAELNWGKVFAPLAAHFRVVAADLRGHGDGIRAGSRYRLKIRQRCRRAGSGPGYRQVHRRGVFHGRHGRPAGVPAARLAGVGSGVVLHRGQRGVPGPGAGRLALPAAAAGLRWNPVLQLVSAEVLGSALLGPIDDPATARWARAQLRLTTLASAVSAIRAVCEFSSDRWISQVDVPAAVVVTTRDRIVPAGRQLQLARAIPGAALHRVDADHAVCITAPQVFARTLLEACQAVQAGSVPADQRLSVA